MRLATLLELQAAAPRADAPDIVRMFESARQREFASCFALFGIVHSLTGRPDVVQRIAREMVEDFADERCVYLEVRTTPRATECMTQEAYVRAVLAGLHEGLAARPAIDARLLLAIDRARMDQQAAFDVVRLAARLRDEDALIVGIDVSGNPLVHPIAPLIEPLREARDKHGLRLAVHFAEYQNDAECWEILERIAPERLGHCCYLNDALRDAIIERGTPIEMCLTSNVITSSVPSYAEHHASEFLARGHPCVFCTDDKCMFFTSLTREYCLAAAHLGLDVPALTRCVRGGVRASFADAATQARVAARIDEALSSEAE